MRVETTNAMNNQVTTKNSAIIHLLCYIVFGAATYISMTNSLNKMTSYDCHVNNIVAACEQLHASNTKFEG